MRRLALLVSLLFLSSTGLAEIDPRRAALSVDTGLGSLGDAQAYEALRSKLEQLGYTPLGNDAFLGAAAEAGVLRNGAMTSGARALEAARLASESAVVVRLYSTGVEGDRSMIRLVVVDRTGARAVEWSATRANVDERVATMVDAAWAEPAIPLSELTPPARAGPSPPGASQPAPRAGPAAPRAGPAAPTGGIPPHAVVFTNGATLRGTIVQEDEGRSVTLRLPDGTVQTHVWANIKRIDRGGTESRMNANVGVGGVQFSQASGCPPGAPPEQCQEHTQVTADTSGAQLRHESDCAPGETDERCRERLQAGVGESGIGVGYSKQSVERVDGPPRSFVASVSLGGNFVYGTGTGDLDFSLLGGGADIAVALLFGKLPGAEGGSFIGGFGEPQLSASYLSMSAGDTSLSVLGGRVGGAGGVQWIKFSPLDEASLKQKGFGLRGGLFLGANYFKPEEMDSDISFAWGPTVGMTFLNYNPATARLKGVDVNLLILPGVNDIFFVMAGVGFKL